MVELPKLLMNFGNLLTTGFDTGDDEATSYRLRAYDAGVHWSCSITDAARPELNSSSSADSRTYCWSVAAIVSVAEFVR